MALVEGLDDAVGQEQARLRGEIRLAIAESRYTVGDVAALSGVSEGQLYKILNGRSAPGLDTLLRIAFVLGVRIEFARPGGEGARPFQVVPSDPSSTSSSASSGSSQQMSDRDQTHDRSSAASKKGSKQQRKDAAPKRDTRGFGAQAA